MMTSNLDYELGHMLVAEVETYHEIIVNQSDWHINKPDGSMNCCFMDFFASNSGGRNEYREGNSTEFDSLIGEKKALEYLYKRVRDGWTKDEIIKDVVVRMTKIINTLDAIVMAYLMDRELMLWVLMMVARDERYRLNTTQALKTLCHSFGEYFANGPEDDLKLPF